MSNFIYDYVDREKYEIIVGLSNTGILGSLEIDIPIMVYDVESNRVYRFAVEYNANFYHSQDRDLKKEALVVNKGWHYKAIIEELGKRYSNNQKLLQPFVINICEYIKSKLENPYIYSFSIKFIQPIVSRQGVIHSRPTPLARNG